MQSSSQAKIIEYYGLAFLATVVIVLGAVFFGGAKAVLPILALAAVEITFSFENAVVNSQVLSTMSRVWRAVFLTVGIGVAVFGVRLLLPLVLVGVTSGQTLSSVLHLARYQPELYAEELQGAYPFIAAFGGVFLIMVGLRFFGEKREILWLNTVEAPLAEYNQPWPVLLVGSAAAVTAIYAFLAPRNNRLVFAAILGALTFIGIKLLSQLLVRASRLQSSSRSHSGLAQFIYLELLDASFSFDGVVAAFAITKEVLLIAAGLGIGAIYVRSITIHLLKSGTLGHYRYLIHGAHYAILSLGVLLLISIKYHIPEVTSGMLGLLILGLAFENSRRPVKLKQNL